MMTRREGDVSLCTILHRLTQKDWAGGHCDTDLKWLSWGP